MAAEVLEDLIPRATEIGLAWLAELVDSLRSSDRELVGAWPGTLSEARMRIRAGVPARIEPQQIDNLARVANLAARRGWHEVAEPDPEI